MDKLKIHIPGSFESEIIYSFKFLLSLVHKDLKYEFITTEEATDFIIEFNDKTITISNSFFRSGVKESPFRKENIPPKSDTLEVVIGGDRFNVETIFGAKQYNLETNDVYFGTDLIAGTFFMLSRWEENVIDKKDNLGRFDYREALSVRSNFYKRPVVDEYALLLKVTLIHLGFIIPESNESASCQMTFDIDQLEKWQRSKILFESLYKNLLRFRFLSAIQDIKSFISSKLLGGSDPYQNLDKIIKQLSDSKISDAVFYFKTRINQAKQDRNRYELDTSLLSKYFTEIKKNKFKIGLHPGFNSFVDVDLMKQETNQLEQHASEKLVFIRQHYLRFEIPKTWSIQEKLGFTYDSSMIYSHSCGFRNGTCHSFRVFDFMIGKPLDIVEVPLLFMETPYMDKPELLMSDFEEIKRQVDKYSGKMVVLWHNGNLEYRWQRKMYSNLLDRVD